MGCLFLWHPLLTAFEPITCFATSASIQVAAPRIGLAPSLELVVPDPTFGAASEESVAWVFAEIQVIGGILDEVFECFELAVCDGCDRIMRGSADNVVGAVAEVMDDVLGRFIRALAEIVK